MIPASFDYQRADSVDAARALLADPSRWNGGTPDGFLRLSPSDAGMAPDAGWV